MLATYPFLQIIQPQPQTIIYKCSKYPANSTSSIESYIEDVFKKHIGLPIGELHAHLFRKYVNPKLPVKINPHALTCYPVRKYCEPDEEILYRHLNRIIRKLSFLKDFRYEKNTLEIITEEQNQSILCVSFYNLWSRTPIDMSMLHKTIKLFSSTEDIASKVVGKLVIMRQMCKGKMVFYINDEKPRSESVNKLFNRYLTYSNGGENEILSRMLLQSKEEKEKEDLVPKIHDFYNHNNNKVIYSFKESVIVMTKLFSFWKKMLFCYCTHCQHHSLSKVSTKTPSRFAYDIVNDRHICTTCYRVVTTVVVHGHMIYIGWDNTDYWQCLGCGDLCREGVCDKKCYELKNNTCYMRTKQDPKTCVGYEIHKGVFVCYNHYKYYNSKMYLKCDPITCKKLHHKVYTEKPSIVFKRFKRRAVTTNYVQ